MASLDPSRKGAFTVPTAPSSNPSGVTRPRAKPSQGNSTPGTHQAPTAGTNYTTTSTPVESVSTSASSNPPQRSSTSSHDINALFTCQSLAPPPSRSTLQLTLTSSHLHIDTIPVKRLSEKWSRDSRMNPTRMSFEWDDIREKKEAKDEVVSAFGKKVWDQIIEIMDES